MAKKLTNKEQSALGYLDSLVSIEYLNVRKDRKSDSATVDFEGFADLNDIADAIASHDAEVRDKALTLTDSELAIAEGASESHKGTIDSLSD